MKARVVAKYAVGEKEIICETIEQLGTITTTYDRNQIDYTIEFDNAVKSDLAEAEQMKINALLSTSKL